MYGEGGRQQDPLGGGPDTPQQRRFGADHLCELITFSIFIIFIIAILVQLCQVVDAYFIFCCIYAVELTRWGGVANLY